MHEPFAGGRCLAAWRGQSFGPSIALSRIYAPAPHVALRCACYMPGPGALRNGAPFEGLPAPLQRLGGVLMRRADGDRLVGEVLACVPRHGLEAVLVAAELILQSCNTPRP